MSQLRTGWEMEKLPLFIGTVYINVAHHTWTVLEWSLNILLKMEIRLRTHSVRILLVLITGIRTANINVQMEAMVYWL